MQKYLCNDRFFLVYNFSVIEMGKTRETAKQVQ